MTQQIFKMRAPSARWYVLGCMAACSLPVTCGLVGLVMRRGEAFFTLPINLTFVFGTIFAAYIGAAKVKASIDEIRKPISFGIIGLQSASWVHLVAATAHFILIYIGVLSHGGSAEGFIEGFFLFLIYGGLIHIVLWVVITCPLSILCGMIFKWVAVKRIAD